MTPTEADELALRLKGLLPRMTQDQVFECAKEFERHDREVVGAAVSRYHREHEEFYMPRLLGVLRQERAARLDAAPSRYTDNNGRVVGEELIDQLRRQPGADGRPDVELIVEHFSAGARAAREAQAAEPFARELARSLTYHQARDALAKAGLDAEEADRRARAACGYTPDEKISVDPIKVLLRSVREEEEAAKLKDLALKAKAQKDTERLIAAEMRDQKKRRKASAAARPEPAKSKRKVGKGRKAKGA